MVKATFDPEFRKSFLKIKDSLLKKKIIKRVEKLKENPALGKPMRYERKGTRELYVPPFRLAYAYVEEEDTIIILGIYHKNKQ